MAHSLFHIILLLAATLGIVALRSRRLLLLAAVLVLPLPAALYNLYAEPASLTGIDFEAIAGAPADRCARPPPSADAAVSGNDQPAVTGGECDEDGTPSRGASLFVVLLINYMTIAVGAAAGLLARRPSRG